MTRPALNRLLRRRGSRTKQASQDRRKQEFLRRLRHEHLEDRRLLAGVVISEIMYNDANNDPLFEYLEVYNSDLQNSVDLTGYFVESNSSIAAGVGTVGAGTVAPGGLAVLYNDAATPAQFEAVWANAGSGVNLIPVSNWQNFNDSSALGTQLGIWDAASNADAVAQNFGTAVDSVDYTSAGFPTSVTNQSIYLTDLTADNSAGANWDISSNATFSVTSVNTLLHSNATVGSPGVAATEVSIGDAQIVEGDAGTSVLVFDVTLNVAPRSGQTINIDYATADDTAAAGADYTAASGTLIFNSSSPLTQQVEVNVSGDITVELDETFDVVLSNLSTTGTFVAAPTILNSPGVGTITNDDAATLNITDNSGDEDDGPITFTATLTNPVDVPVVFDVALGTVGDTALVTDNDYSPVSLAGVSITAGALSTTFVVTPTADSVVESDETFSLAPTSLNVGSPPRDVTAGPSGTGTIVNDDAALVSVANVSATELDGGDTPTFDFIVTLSNPLDLDATVPFTLTGDTATVGTDYNATPAGNVTIPAGATSAPVVVTIEGDDIVEADETIDFAISGVTTTSPRNVSVDSANDEAVGTIVDDDAATIVIVDQSAAEDVAAGELVFMVALAGEVDQPFTVNFATANGATNPAAAGSDYTAVSSSVNFSGALNQTVAVSVPLTNDNVVELDEQFLGNLSNISLAGTHDITFADDQAVGTITNDDNAVVSIADVSQAEGTSATATVFDFVVSLSNPVDVNVTFDHQTVDGAAAAGSDFVGLAATQSTFSANNNSDLTIPVSVTADNIVEATELFQLQLNSLNSSGRDVSFSGAGPALLGFGEIVNDDSASVRFTPATATVSQDEGTGGVTTTFTFDVELSNPVDSNVNVTYETADGTALVADGDYQGAAGSLLLPAGTLSDSIEVLVSQDATVELDEAFELRLTDATPAAPRAVDLEGGVVQVATGVILNDDFAELTIDDVTLAEGDSGTQNAIFTVSVDNSVATAFTVDFATAADTASDADNDFTAVSGTLSFTGASGESQTISVPVVGDTKVELNEQFFVNLSNVVAANPALASLIAITDGQGAGAITNDDDAELTITDISIAEGNSGATSYDFIVNLSNPADVDVEVDYAVALGAAAAADFVSTAGGAATVTAGSSSATISIEVQGDTTVELDESFLVNLSNLQVSGRDITMTDSSAAGVIVNDDAAELTIADATVNEGDSGAADIVFTVSLDQPVDVNVQADYAVNLATADAADLVSTAGGTVTILAGATSATITLQSQGDTTVELDETFTIDLSNLQAAGRDVTIADSQAAGLIVNDDNAEASVDDVSVVEGDAGTAQLIFTVTLTGPVDVPVAFDFATADDTATAGSDYTSLPTTGGSVSAGDLTTTIVVEVGGDELVELDETLELNISNFNPAGRDVTLVDAQGVGTIANDDSATISVSDVTLLENADGGAATAFNFVVTLSAAVDTSLSVDFATADGVTPGQQALQPADYAAVSGSSNFAGNLGEQQTVTVVVVNDDAYELTEEFFLNLTDIAAAGRDVTFADDQGLGEILNDDTDLIINGTPDDDTLTIVATSDNDGSLVLTTNGVAGPTIPLVDITSVLFNGGDGDDIFVLDQATNSVIFSPVGGIQYNGEGQALDAAHNPPGDALELLGVAGDLTYDVTGPDAGVISDSSGTQITFTGLEPVSTGGTVANFIINLGPADNEGILTTSGSDLNLSSTNASFEGITFPVPSGSLTINGDAGADAITVDDVTGLFSGDLFVELNTGAGDTEADTTILANGGLINTDVVLRANDRLEGSGTVSGAVSSSSASTTIESTGTLVLGDGSTAGFSTEGDLIVGANIVTLVDANVAVLGENTTLAGGTLDAANGISLSAGETLSGNGAVNGAINQNSGTVDPQGVLAAQAGVSLGTGSLQMQVNSLASLDQLDVTGVVQLGGSLDLSTTGFSGADGDVFVLINNDGADAVTGAFTNAADGDTVSIGPDEFKVFYNGGDGNDVVLVKMFVPLPIVYVDDSFAGTIPGTDPDGAGPATSYLVDSFPVVQQGVDAVDLSGTVSVYTGTYAESVAIAKPLLLAEAAGETAEIAGEVSTTEQLEIAGLDVNANAAGGAVASSSTSLLTVSDASLSNAGGPVVATVGVPTVELTNVSLSGVGAALDIQAADQVTVSDSVLTAGASSQVQTLTLTYNTTGADDAININTAGIGGATRLQQAGNNILELTGATTINVDSGAGEDTVTVSPDLAAVLNLQGGDPLAPATPGDQLIYIAGPTPVTDTGSAIQAPGVQDVNYAGFETLAIAGSIVINGGPSDDVLEITASSADSGIYQLNSGPIVGFTLATSFTFNGFGGNDELIIHNPAGGQFAPTAGVTFDGGTGTDFASIDGGMVTTVLHDVFDASSGDVYYDGALALDYNNVEGPLTDEVGANDRIFQTNAAAESIVISDAAPGLTSFLSTSGSIEILFASPTDSLTADLANGVDALDIQGLDPSFSADFTVTSDGGDSVAVTGPISTGEAYISADTINVAGAVNSNNDDVTLEGAATLGDSVDAGTGLIRLVGSANQTGGALIAAELLMIGGGPFVLPLGNDVNSVAADVTGALEMNDTGDLAVTTVDGVPGITSTATVDLTTGGTITLDEAVSAAGQLVTLTAGNMIVGDGSPAIDVTADTLEATAVNGIGSVADPLDLAVASLLFGNSTAGDVVLTNAGSLTVLDPSVNDGGDVSLLVSGGVAINGTLHASGSISLATVETPAPTEHVAVAAGASVTADGDIQILSGDDVTVGAGGEIVAQGAVQIATGQADADGGGAIDYGSGEISGDTSVDLDAIEDIDVGATVSSGLVTMDTIGGHIRDNDSATVASVAAAGGLIVNAAGGDINLTLQTPAVEGSSDTAIDLLSPAANLTIGGLGPQVGLASDGPITVAVDSGGGSAGTLNVDEAVDSESGGVLLYADDDLTINAPVTSGGGDISLASLGDVLMSAAALADTEGGSGNASLLAGGNLTMADGAFVEALGGDILAQVTDATLGRLFTNNRATLNAGGNVIDGGDSGGADVQAAELLLTVAGATGALGNPLDTQVGALEGLVDGGLWMDNAGDLIVGGVEAGVSGLGSSGDISIVVNNGSLDVTEDVIADGAVDLTTNDGAGGGQWIAVRTTRTVSSANLGVSIVSGDDLTLEDSSTVSAASDLVSLSGDIADADPGLGATIQLYGTVVSGTPAEVLGGPDGDIIDVNPGSSHTVDSALLDAQGDDDLYLIQFGRLNGVIDIVDSGVSGGDAAETHGTADDEELIVHNNETNGVAPQTGGFVENTTQSELVTYTETLELLLVHGQDGEDVFDVQPSQSTEITIDGGSPTFGDPLPNGGDELDFDSFSNYFFINGKTIETEGGSPDPFMDVNFRNIEQLPLDPLGADTLLFDFDQYDPATQTLTSQTETGWTSVATFTEYGVSGPFGWLSPLTSAGFTTEGDFDRGPGSAADFDALVRDGQFSSEAEVFQADVTDGWYLVSAKMGDDFYARDQMQIRDLDSGRVMAADVTTSIGEVADLTFVVLVDDGTLTLEFSDLGGDAFWTLNSLEVRPADLLSIGTPDPGPIVGDGETIDTFAGFEATPDALITITASAGTLLPGQDVSPDFAGVQVRADAAGEFSYQILRPAGRATSLIGMQEVSGAQTGCLVIDYEAPLQWQLDFNRDDASPLEPGYLSVLPDREYLPGSSGIGWSDPLVSAGYVTQGGFERGAVSPADQADARVDGHFSFQASTFSAEVQPGVYYVNATIGDQAFARDLINITVNGVPLATDVTTSAGEYFHRQAAVSVGPAGVLEFEVDDLGGDQFWVLNSIEIREASLVGAVSFNSLGGSPVPADGLTVATVTGSTAAPDGTLLTVGVDLGAIVGTPLGAGAQDVYQQTQVEVSGGAFSFDYQFPATAGTPTFTATAVDGSVMGESNSVVSFITPPFTRYDFDARDGDTQPGYVGVRAADVWAPGDTFGWLSSPREFQRTDAVPYSMTSVPFYRDGHWGAGGSAGAKTFRVAVSPGGAYDVQVTVGDRSYGRDQIEITGEDGAVDTQIGKTTKNQWQVLTLLNTADSNNDGYLDITVSDNGGDPFWVVNGIDVASPTQLPLPTPQLAEGLSGDAASVSPADLEAVKSAALSMYAASGIDADTLAQLAAVPIQIRDMDSHGYLGLSYHSRILIDDNAYGAGWHVDVNTAPVDGSVDLLSTVLHELGHQLGRADHFDDPHDIMFGRLGANQPRRLSGSLDRLGGALDGDADSKALADLRTRDTQADSLETLVSNDAAANDEVFAADGDEWLVDVRQEREEREDELFLSREDEDDEEEESLL